MKILLLDDQRDLMRVYTEKLKASQHEVLMVGDMTTAQLLMKKATADNKPFNLVVIDLLLKRFEPAFQQEHDMISQAMTQARLNKIPTGQALGLRLWQSPPRTPYCYLSAHPAYWMRMVGSPLIKEFEGANDTELCQLLLEKDRIRLAGLEQTLSGVVALWRQKGWAT